MLSGMAHVDTWKGTAIYTIGHSSRAFDDFIAMLRSFDVSVVADIRTIPCSRTSPQFNGDALASCLTKSGFRYAHLPRLGGLRRARNHSPSLAWRDPRFRGFADYMLSVHFEEGLGNLHALLTHGRVALMCGDAAASRCHRSLVADALVARGASVTHITGVLRSIQHCITPFANVEGEVVTYPGVRDAS
jgi:uncharacterized protein (DUF488 family)